MSQHPTETDMTPHIPENSLVDWCLVINMDGTIPPRNPNDDEDEDEERTKTGTTGLRSSENPTTTNRAAHASTFAA